MKLKFTSKFNKQVSKVTSKKLATEIYKIIEAAENAKSINELKNLKKLSGYKFHYRIRIGDYRIGLFLDREVLEFTAFDHRKDIYRYFP